MKGEWWREQAELDGEATFVRVEAVACGIPVRSAPITGGLIQPMEAAVKIGILEPAMWAAPALWPPSTAAAPARSFWSIAAARRPRRWRPTCATARRSVPRSTSSRGDLLDGTSTASALDAAAEATVDLLRVQRLLWRCRHHIPDLVVTQYIA